MDIDLVYVAKSRCIPRLREIIAEINLDDPGLQLNWKENQSSYRDCSVMKKLVLLLLLAAFSAGASEIRFQLYKNGFCTGNPSVSADRDGHIFRNGFCTGNPSRSFHRQNNVSRLYPNGFCTGNPKWSVRFEGTRAYFFRNGFCTGNPEKSFEIQRGDLHFFNTGFCTGNPSMCIRKNRDMIQIYPNGYGAGNPTISIGIRGGASAWDVVELFLFYCVIGMR